MAPPPSAERGEAQREKKRERERKGERDDCNEQRGREREKETDREETTWREDKEARHWGVKLMQMMTLSVLQRHNEGGK